MHTGAMPKTVVDNWLEKYPSTVKNYGHLLLEQRAALDADALKAFRAYFESAHLDARRYFHELIGMDLHPDADHSAAHAKYPSCLPPEARKGLFGEVMSGLLTEHYKFVGEHDWKVPIFLFRHHADVEHYLFALARDPARKRAVFGRFGSDFIAIAMDEDGQVVRYLSGEAKWRKNLTEASVEELMLGKWVTAKDGTKTRDGKGIWGQLNKDTELPHGLRQLQRLLKECDPAGFAAAIASIDGAVMLKNPTPLPRTNLVLLCGNDPDKREAATPWLDWETIPAEYKAPHDLQVIEMFLTDGEVLIKQIYDSLWRDGK